MKQNYTEKEQLTENFKHVKNQKQYVFTPFIILGKNLTQTKIVDCLGLLSENYLPFISKVISKKPDSDSIMRSYFHYIFQLSCATKSYDL